MSSAKYFGCAINVEAEEEGGSDGNSIAVEVSRSSIQPDVEAMSLSVCDCFPPLNQREIVDRNPYYHFIDSNSDSGTSSMDAEPGFIDFFDRELNEVDTNQRVSTSVDLNIELGLGIGSGSGQLRGDSGGVGVHRETDSGWVEVDTGRVEVDTGRVEVGDNLNLYIVEAMVVEEEFLEGENSQWLEEPVQVIPFDWQTIWDADNILDDLNHMMDLDAALDLAEDGENHDALLAQMFDNQDGVRGSPPASKSVVDDLPSVVITSEELSDGNIIVCAICKDDIAVEEKAKRLPCKHYYHGECIIPWLGIRNTCPVCRYELPTDDLEYETERNRRLQRQRRNRSSLARESMNR